MPVGPPTEWTAAPWVHLSDSGGPAACQAWWGWGGLSAILAPMRSHRQEGSRRQHDMAREGGLCFGSDIIKSERAGWGGGIENERN